MNFELNEAELRRLDLNLLLVFSAVMRTGSAKGAAEHLYLGPSAVSMALSRLRDHIGDSLFVRGKAGLEPTIVAQRLFEQLGPALETISNALRDLTLFDPGQSDRTFRIGMTDDLEWWLFPLLRSRIAAAAPGAVVIVRAADYMTAHDQLDTGRVDIVITAHPIPRSASFHSESLYLENFIVLAASDCVLPDGLSMEDYLRLPHVLVSAGGTPWGIMDTELERLGKRRSVVSVVQHFLTLPDLLGKNGPIATMPRRPGQLMAGKFGLQLRELPLPSPSFETGLLWHRRSHTDPALLWLRAQIIQSISEAGASGGEGVSTVRVTVT